MSSKKLPTQAGSIATPQKAQIEIVSRRKVIYDNPVVADDKPVVATAAEVKVPIGTLNVEVVKDVKDGLDAEIARARATVQKYGYGAPTTSAQTKELKVAQSTVAHTTKVVMRLNQLLAKWQVVSKEKSIIDSGKTKVRTSMGLQKEINVTGLYKNMHQQKFQAAARQYNAVASAVRQCKIPLLTPEMVPNAIKGHQIRAKRCNLLETSGYCTTDQCETSTDDLYFVMHQSRRHTCRCESTQLKSLLTLAIRNGILGVRSQAKQFGKADLFPKSIAEKECLLIRCCGIMSTGGQCLALMDPLDPALLELLAPMLAIAVPVADQECDGSNQPSTVVTDAVADKETVSDTESETAAIQAAMLLEAEEAGAFDDAEDGMGVPMGSEAEPPAFTTIEEYKVFVTKYYRVALQNKYGMDIYTYCPDDKCPMHVNGFFVDEILQRRIKGAKDDEFITGYHANCPSCKTFWCLNCKTDHRGKICPGPYAQYMPDIEREAIEDYKVTHAEEPSALASERLVAAAIHVYRSENKKDPDATTVEHLRRTAILAFKRQHGPEPVDAVRTKCLDDARKRFYATNKMCPNCKKMTYKIPGGCNHIECVTMTFKTNDGRVTEVKGCGHHWCFRCGGNRDPRNHHTHTCPEGIEYDVEFDSRSEQLRRPT